MSAILHQMLMAAYPPGAIVNPINPADASGLVRWYRAQSLSLSDNDAIASWTDLSPAANHATQGTASARPTFKAGIINGKAVARFDGGDVLRFAELFDTSGANALMLVVANKTGSGDGVLLSTRPSSVPQGWGIRVNSTTALTYFHTGQSPSLTKASSSGWRIYGVSRNGLSAQLIVGDSVDSAVSIAGYATSSLNATDIGQEANGSNRFIGDIAEILILDNTDAAQRAGLIQYLKNEYAL